MNKKLFKKIIIIISLVFLGGGFGYYFHQKQQKARPAARIIDFDYGRDAQGISKIFERDKYWLLSTPDYDVEHMMKERAPSQREPKYFGKLILKVLYEKEKLVGFVAYYLKNSYRAQLLFIDVNPEFRGKGYAQELMKYALNELKTMGAQKVRLVTRVDNFGAQKLYKRTGYTETGRDDTFMFFEREL